MAWATSAADPEIDQIQMPVVLRRVVSFAARLYAGTGNVGLGAGAAAR